MMIAVKGMLADVLDIFRLQAGMKDGHALQRDSCVYGSRTAVCLAVGGGNVTCA
jgi:hypothetical protein